MAWWEAKFTTEVVKLVASSFQLQNYPSMKEDLSFYHTDTCSNTTS